MNDGRVFLPNGVGMGRRRQSGGTALYGHYEGDDRDTPAVEVSAMDIDAKASWERFATHNAWDAPVPDKLVARREELMFFKNRAIQSASNARNQHPADEVLSARHFTEAAKLEAEIAAIYLEQQDYANAMISLQSASSCATMASLAAERLKRTGKS